MIISLRNGYYIIHGFRNFFSLIYFQLHQWSSQQALDREIGDFLTEDGLQIGPKFHHTGKLMPINLSEQENLKIREVLPDATTDDIGQVMLVTNLQVRSGGRSGKHMSFTISCSSSSPSSVVQTGRCLYRVDKIILMSGSAQYFLKCNCLSANNDDAEGSRFKDVGPTNNFVFVEASLVSEPKIYKLLVGGRYLIVSR